MKKLLDSVKFNLIRETKGAYVFEEDSTTGAPKVGTLYMRKWAFQSGAPQSITVSIAVTTKT